MFHSSFAIRAAIAATAVLILAQSGSSAVAAGPSFPCNAGDLTPTQIAICSDDGLAALEQRVADIYSAQLAKLPANQHAGFIAQERAFLQKAEACGINKTCIRNAYAARIQQLSPAPPPPAPPAAAGPSFTCSGQLAPTEIAICSDDGLAALDRQVTDIYSRKLASLPASQHQALIDAEKSWLATRNACGINKVCIRNAYNSRIQQLNAPAPAPARQVSCNEAVGSAQASVYVNQCLEVSPATHPPCNASNACALIIAEIRRGCGMAGPRPPAFCAAYR